MTSIDKILFDHERDVYDRMDALANHYRSVCGEGDPDWMESVADMYVDWARDLSSTDAGEGDDLDLLAEQLEIYADAMRDAATDTRYWNRCRGDLGAYYGAPPRTA